MKFFSLLKSALFAYGLFGNPQAALSLSPHNTNDKISLMLSNQSFDGVNDLLFYNPYNENELLEYFPDKNVCLLDKSHQEEDEIESAFFDVFEAPMKIDRCKDFTQKPAENRAREILSIIQSPLNDQIKLPEGKEARAFLIRFFEQLLEKEFGVKLLERLLKSLKDDDARLFFKEEVENSMDVDLDNSVRLKKTCVVVSFNKETNIPFYTLIEKQILLSPQPPFMYILHELIHAVHAIENVFDYYNLRQIPHLSFSHEEERRTITGNGGDKYDCHNEYVAVEVYKVGNKRFSHMSKDLSEKTLNPTKVSLPDLINSQALDVAIKFIVNNPEGILFETDENKNTALHQLFLLKIPENLPNREAWVHKRDFLIDHLLAKRLDPNARNKYGHNLLHIAAHAQHNDAGLITKALKLTREINSQDNTGQTPMHYASYSGNKQALEILLQNGADKDITTNEGQTPLHYAAGKGHVKAVEILVQDADVTIEDNKGYTALDLARHFGNKDISIILEEAVSKSSK
ncbi:MAG: Phosphocholine transferase AnkX [Candidatus Anoxychlamydiales bacterium]|nr:Phosphocholine transferase AnkX [Candidatus Anoxychlamydiales bacterium]